MAHGLGIKVSKGKQKMRLLSLVLLDKYCLAIDYALKVLVRLQRFSGDTCALSTPPLSAHCASRAPPLEILARLQGIPENLKAPFTPTSFWPGRSSARSSCKSASQCSCTCSHGVRGQGQDVRVVPQARVLRQRNPFVACHSL